MKRIAAYVFIILIITLSGCAKEETQKNAISQDTYIDEYQVIMKRDLLCLMMAYPEHITGIHRGEDGRVYVIMKSGKRILYDDKRTKAYDEKIENPDLQDMMEQVYPLISIDKLFEKGFDPGRVRVYPLLKEVYGNSQKNVEKSLKTVRFVNRNCRFNGNNKAAEALKKAGTEVLELSKRKSGISAYVFPVSGTFSYRVISGTSRLSAHSFGTAIDLAVSKYDYWKWASREQGQKRMASYPKEIVRIFENNGFIWGGKWGHFDIMHYEYRPELIFKSRYFADKPIPGEYWYKGVALEDAKIKDCIQLIDKALK